MTDLAEIEVLCDPEKPAGNGQDPKSGQFVRGNRLGGRPKGLDFRAAVERYASANGIDLENAVGEVFKAMLTEAKAGDVQAARLILDRLCGSVPKEHRIEGEITPLMPQIPRGRDLVEWARKLHELAEADEDD